MSSQRGRKARAGLMTGLGRHSDSDDSDSDYEDSNDDSYARGSTQGVTHGIGLGSSFSTRRAKQGKARQEDVMSNDEDDDGIPHLSGVEDTRSAGSAPYEGTRKGRTKHLTGSQMSSDLDKAEGRGNHRQNSGEASSSQPGAARFILPANEAYDSRARDLRKHSSRFDQPESARQSIHQGVEPSTTTVHSGYKSELLTAAEDRVKVLEAALRRKEADNESLRENYASSVENNKHLQVYKDLHDKEKQVKSDPNAASGGGNLLGGRGRSDDAKRRDAFDEQWVDDENDRPDLTDEFAKRRGVSAFSTSRKKGMVEKMRGVVHVTADMLRQVPGGRDRNRTLAPKPKDEPKNEPKADSISKDEDEKLTMRLEKLKLLREQKDSQERLVQSMVKIASKVMSDDDGDDDGYNTYGRSRRAADSDDRRHSTGKSAEEKQLTYELNLRATSLMKSSLTKEEVATYALSLEYGEHEGQLDELLAHLALTDEAVAEVLEYQKNPTSMLTHQGKLKCEDSTTRDLYEKADRYVARCIVQCLNSTTPRVKKYRLDLREYKQGFRLSGLGILMTIHQFMKPKTGDDIQKIKDAWDKQEFFTVA